MIGIWMHSSLRFRLSICRSITRRLFLIIHKDWKTGNQSIIGSHGVLRFTAKKSQLNVCTCGARACGCLWIWSMKHSLIKEPSLLPVWCHFHIQSQSSTHTLWLPHVTGMLILTRGEDREKATVRPTERGRGSEEERGRDVKWPFVNVFD